MEFLIFLVVLAIIVIAFHKKEVRKAHWKSTQRQQSSSQKGESANGLVSAAPQAPSTPAPQKHRTADKSIKGKCWVIGGDTIVIDKRHIRLAGIDAPEMNHPWGKKAKWELVKLCKGKIVTANIEPGLSYDRAVATCLLEDGTDLSAAMVEAGLALDWPKFSGGKYAHLEQAGIRKRLWRADLKQKGAYNEEKHG